jgi:hypothetical protein
MRVVCVLYILDMRSRGVVGLIKEIGLPLLPILVPQRYVYWRKGEEWGLIAALRAAVAWGRLLHGVSRGKVMIHFGCAA